MTQFGDDVPESVKLHQMLKDLETHVLGISFRAVTGGKHAVLLTGYKLEEDDEVPIPIASSLFPYPYPSLYPSNLPIHGGFSVQ